MKKLVALIAIALGCGLLVWTSDARATDNDEAQIRDVLNRWAKAFRAHDLDGIMSMYDPGVVAYDIVPPLQYVGATAYRKDYQQFLDQYNGPIDVEFRELHIVAGNRVAFVTALEMSPFR